MPDTTPRKLLSGLILCLLALTWSSLLAQDVVTDTPIEITPSDTPTDIPVVTSTEIATEIPTTAPTETAISTETATDVPTATLLAETAESTTEPAIITPTVDATATSPTALSHEPELSLLKRELFESETLIGWPLPTGWTRIVLNEGFALQINAQEAGLSSAAIYEGTYYNLVAMGYFTLADAAASAQLIVRDSSAGSYVAQVDANGFVTLEKRDGTGVAVASWNAIAPSQTIPGAARALRLSAINDVLRVAVDDIEVLAVSDTTPLPPGNVKIGAHFTAPADGQSLSGAITFDNFFLWVPTSELPLYQPTTVPPTSLPTITVVTPPPPTSDTFNGKSTIPEPQGLIAGAQATGNDNFADRLIAVLPYSDSGDTTDNSVEPPDEPSPNCGFNISRTAWYEFMPPMGGASSEPYLLTTAGSSFDTMIAIYTGTGTLASLTQVGCADDALGVTQAQLTINLTDGITYYIQLGGYNGNAGNFAFKLIRSAETVVPGMPTISNTAVGAPSTPVGNAGKINLLNPIVAWNPSGAVVPHSYEIQVSTTNNFATTAATGIVYEPNRYFEISPALPEPALPTGQVYYWRVRSRNFLLQSSAWSAVYSFTLDRVASFAPALIAPTLNGIAPTLRPTFSWQPIADVNRYRVRVASNFSCSTTVLTAEATSTTFTFPSNLAQGEYWFCVEAKDTAGNWSGFLGEKRRFIVNISLTPSQGALVFPSAQTTTANVTFTWTTVPGAIYGIEIADDSSFTGSVIYQELTDTSYTRNALPFGIYYWRVRVNGAELPMSLARNVVVTPPLPVAPTIQTTSTNAVKNLGFTNDTTPLMDWTTPTNWLTLPIAQSITYELQLSTNKTFTALVSIPITGISFTDYEWTATTLPNTPGTMYYWRVRARTNLGLFGAWSAPYSFTLDTTPPNPPAALTAPAEAFVSTSARPVFTWTAPTGGASSYRFQISTDNTDFDPPALPDAIVTTSRYAPTISLPQGIYYWQVWARDTAGNESLTPTGFRTLTVDYRTAPAANYTAITTTTSNVTFAWIPVAGAPSGTPYTIEIDADFDTNPDTTLPPVTSASTIASGLVQGDYQYRLTVSNGFGTSGWRTFYVSAPLPGAPRAPFSPANNAFTANTTPLLTWTAPLTNPGAVAGYWVEISTSSTFNTLIAGSAFDAGAATTFTPPTLTENKYYWRVRAYNALGANGVYSAPWYFNLDTTPPNPPAALTAPAEAFVSTSARPVFTWTAPTGGASSYRFQISADNADFDPPALPDAVVTTPRYAPTVSLPQGIYYWQVWARDAAGNESLTPTAFRTLTVDYRTAPAANHTAITTTTSNVTFSWMMVAGAPSGTPYTIEIDADFDTNPDTTLPPVTSASTIASGLAQGDYQYRLTVNNGFGTSDWRTFYVSVPLPGAPRAPFSPANNTFTFNTTPLLTWTAPLVNPGAVAGYWVEISTASNFSAPIAGSPFDAGLTTSFTPPPMNDATYYWRVRAYTALGIQGVASAPWYFTVDTFGPNVAPNLITPLDNAITNLPRPTFIWAPATGVTRYLIEIDDENTFSNPLFHTATVTTTSYTLPTSTYLRQGIYYWRVWAMDAAGNLNPGPLVIRTLKVNYAKTPANNAVITSPASAKVTFTWSPVPIAPIMPSSLRLQIDNNSDFTSLDANSSPLLPSNIVTYTTPSGLPHGKYYWRLVVTGHPTWSVSMAQSFTISPASPPAPVLSAPPSAINDTSPLFNWNAVSSPSGATVTGYELQLSTTNTFTALVGGAPISIAGGGTTSYEWGSALPETTGQMYYARLRAVTSLDIYSNWSVVRIFTLDTTPPAIPTLNSPANNAVSATPTPTFTWTAVTGAARYEIRYGASPNLVGVSPVSVTTTSHKVAVALSPGNIYWEVRALDAAGNAIDWDDSGVWNTATNRRTVKIAG